MSTTFIDNPRYPSEAGSTHIHEDKPIRPDSIDVQFKKIISGKNKGFYKRDPPRSLKFENKVFTKAFFPKKLEGPYDHYLLQHDDFYYVPRNDTIPIRKLVYGLQNNLMPTSGNIELYNKEFNFIRVPFDFCPIIDPCPYDWCTGCLSGFKKSGRVKRRISIMNLFYFILFVWCISNVVMYGLLF